MTPPPSSHSEQSEASREPTQVEVRSPGAILTVLVYPGAGEPVLLLHGGPGYPNYLDPITRILAPLYQVIAFDQRGVGASRVCDGRFGIDDYLADIEAIREQLGIERWHVFGHSWGGLLGQVYAYTYPSRVRSLFLCNAALGVGPDWRRSQRAQMHFQKKQSGALGWLAIGLWSVLMRLPGAIGAYATQRLFVRIIRNYFRDPASAPPDDPRLLRGTNGKAYLATDQALQQTDPARLPAILRALPYPVLVLYGGYDIFGEETRVVRERYPEARQEYLEDSGHQPWLQAPQAFQAILTDFYSLEKRA